MNIGRLNPLFREFSVMFYPCFNNQISLGIILNSKHSRMDKYLDRNYC
jgi:hypothetical protein